MKYTNMMSATGWPLQGKLPITFSTPWGGWGADQQPTKKVPVAAVQYV